MAHQEKVYNHYPFVGVHEFNQYVGGKVKPLKAPKKDKKEMDEDEIAFKAKQAAGKETGVRVGP